MTWDLALKKEKRKKETKNKKIRLGITLLQQLRWLPVAGLAGQNHKLLWNVN
jgi:hypothetical protein